MISSPACIWPGDVRGRPSNLVALDTPDPIGEQEALHGILGSMFGEAVGPPSVGRFILKRQIGVGGMAMVYEAFDPQLQRSVAIKFLLREQRRREEAASDVKRLVREARALARIRHPNVVSVHDVGTWERGIYIVMEYVDGGDLARWIGQSSPKGRSPTEVIRRFVEAGRGLQAAHEAGLVHRDFKPANVLVATDGRIQVTDFGLVKDGALHEGASSVPQWGEPSDDARLTHSGAVLGTPAYMAPEQILGRLATDHRVDQFAFCVSLWEALFRRRPFGALTLGELHGAIMDGPPPAPAGCSRRLYRVLRRGLAARRSDRYQSMSALLRDLTRSQSTRWRGLVIPTLALAAAGAVLGDGPRADRECVMPHGQLDGVWDASARARVAGRIAHDVSAGRDVPTGLVDTLDAYAEDWVRAREQACEIPSSRQRGAVEHAVTIGCLELSRAQLSTLVGLLADEEQANLFAAAAVARGIPSPMMCHDPGVLRRTPSPPESVRPVVLDIRVRTAEAELLASAGALRRAREVMSETLEAAREVGHPPSSSAAALMAAKIEMELGHIAKARPLLEEAYETAVLGGNDVRAYHALVGLVYLHGIVEGDLQLGRSHARNAALLEQTLGDEISGLERSMLQLQLGQLARREGELATAAVHLEHAVELIRAAAEPRPAEFATASVGLATVLVAWGDEAEAAMVLEDAVAFAASAGAHSTPAMAKVWLLKGRIARVSGHAGGTQEASACFERALTMLASTVGPNNPGLVLLLNDLGLLRRQQGRLGEALALFARASRILDQTDAMETQRVILEGNIADVWFDRGEVERAEEHARRAAEVARSPSVATALRTRAQDRVTVMEGRHGSES